ncbi:MAG: PAS domain-containing protein [Mariprofundaceae bacterium]|nr:PAS domain-containing protein [Mariprofundaceae bacterium]
MNCNQSPPFHVLIIEDDSTYSAMIASYLETSNDTWHIEVASTTTEAYTLLDHQMMDIILFDLDITEFNVPSNGKDAASTALLHLKQCRSICNGATAIVAITHRHDDIGSRVIECGGQDCLIKDEISPFTLVHAMHDAVERQQLRQNLSHTQQQIESTTALMNRCIDNALVGIWDYDLRHHRMYLSPHWKKMLGYTHYTIPNKEEWWLTLVHPDDLARVEAAIRQHMDKRSRHFRTEHRLRHHDGHWIWVYSSGAVTWSDDGRPLYRSGTTVDISDRKRLEGALQETLIKLQQEHKRKERFLSSIGHDIRTPMNAILGFSELMLRALEDGDLDKQQLREHLKLIHSNGELLNGLLSDLLELSRLHSNDVVAVNKTIHLWRLLETSILVFRPSAKEKGLDFQLLIDPSIPMSINIDGERLRRIIYHLLSNAVKHTDDGYILVHASFTQGQFALRVENTGARMTTKQKRMLHRNLEESAQHKITEGIGLSICSGLTRILGGKLHLKDRVGGGSVFSLTLPISHDVVVARFNAVPRVICISHDPSCARYISHAVVTWGGQCVVATTPPAQVSDVDVLLMDIREQRGGNAWPSSPHNTQRAIIYDTLNHEHDVEPYMLAQGVTHLTWPIQLSELYRLLDSPVASSTVATGTEEARLPLNVLVVEDTEINRKVAYLMLRKLGVQHTFAVNGTEALALYRAHHYDFVLLDLNLPDISGKEVAAGMRAIEADTWGRTFICALTADARPELQDDIPELDEFLTKPLSTERLSTVLDSRDSIQSSIESATFHNTLDLLGDEAESFVHEFFQQLRSSVAKMQAALLAEEYSAIYDVCHSLKSAAGYVGAVTLSHLCETLCACTKHQHPVWDDVQHDVDQLGIASEQVMEALHKEFAHVLSQP